MIIVPPKFCVVINYVEKYQNRSLASYIELIKGRMSMFPFYKELVAPTAVTHAIEGRFTALRGRDLVVTRSSQIQLYHVKEEVKEGEKSAVTLVAQHNLSGVIASLGVIKAPQSTNGIDYLLVAFKDAKMSLLEFDLTTNRFTTVSLHYYERDEFKNTLLENHTPTQIRVDPNQRCSALHIYGTKLAVLPLVQKEDLFQIEVVNAGHQPYLSSFVIDLSQVGARVLNVIDVCFLHAYFNPTLAVLYTTEFSHSGTPYKPDTVSLLILSIDLVKRTYPVIYQKNNLPIDALRLIPLPKPACGVMLVCSTSLIHVNQGTSGHGLGLNRFASRISNYPHSQTLDLDFTLEQSSSVLLSRTELLFSLRDGSLYLLNISLEGSRVAELLFEKTGSAVPASLACRVGPNMVFLGSSIGDSLLIWFAKANVESEQMVSNEPRVLTDLDDLYNDHVDQNEADTQLDIQQSSNYTFNVVDSWLSIGPIADLSMGSSEYLWEYLDEELPQIRPTHNDIVCCSGLEKSGSLNILQRNLRPKILSTFELQGCQYIWTLHCHRRSSLNIINAPITTSKFHDYLILTQGDRTLTLSAGDELREIEGKQFFSSGPTIVAGSLPSLGWMIQVYKTGMRLLNNDGLQIHTRTLATNRRPEQMVVWGQVWDPYILIQRGDDTLSLFKVRSDTQDFELLDNENLLNASMSASACLFKDTLGRLQFFNEIESLETLFKHKEIHEDAITAIDEDPDLEENLYGNDSPHSPEANAEPKESAVPVNRDSRHFLFNVHVDGSLHIYHLPDMRLCYVAHNFDDFPSLITDTSTEDDINIRVLRRQRESNYLTPVSELRLFEIGTRENNIYMFISGENEEVIVYEVFPDFSQSGSPDTELSLAVRFNRLSFNQTLWKRPPGMPKKANIKKSKRRKREDLYIKKGDTDDSSDSSKSNRDDFKSSSRIIPKKRTVSFPRFCPFGDVAGYSGVFIAGSAPLMAIATSKQDLQVHRLGLDDEVVAFAPLHNPNCSRGFVYYTKTGQLRLAQLPPYYRLDLELAVRKVPLHQTPHRLAYHAPSRTYGLITSTPELFQPNEDFPPMPDLEETNGYQPGPAPFHPTVSRFQLNLVSPITWEIVDTYTFAPNEHVTSCISVGLDTKYQARRTFLAVSTSLSQGEEVVIRGKIYLFDVIDVVPEPNNPRTNHKLKLIVSEDIKAPVTALAGVNGYLVSCVGSKIIIRSFKDGEGLDGVAFIDVQIYVCSVSTIKNYILIGDAYKSVWFLGFQEEPAKLILLGKDFNNTVAVQSTQFLIHGPHLSFLVSDQEGNSFVMNYAPKDLQSINGQKLIYKGDFNMGRLVTNWVRIPCASAINFSQKVLKSRRNENYGESDPLSRTEDGELITRFYSLGGTVEGSIVVMIPTNEAVYRRLHLLSSGLIHGLTHLAGLNPRSYRLMTPRHRLSQNAHKSVLDGDLLTTYSHLPTQSQISLAQSIGTSRNIVYGDLWRLLHYDLQIF